MSVPNIEESEEVVNNYHKKQWGDLIRLTVWGYAVLVVILSIFRLIGIEKLILLEAPIIIWYGWKRLHKENEESSNQGPVLLLFLFGLIICIGLTLWLTACGNDAMFSGLNISEYWWHIITMIEGGINLAVWITWIYHSFEWKPKEGAYLFQLLVGGSPVQWGQSLRSSWYGLCKGLPFPNLTRIHTEAFSQERVKVHQEKGSPMANGKTEDGQRITVNSDVPVVVKWTITVYRAYTYGCMRAEKPIEQIPPTVTTAFQSILDKIGSEAFKADGTKMDAAEQTKLFEAKKTEIAKSILKKTKDELRAIGLKAVNSSIQSIEQPGEVEAAIAEKRVTVTKAEADAAALDIATKAFVRNQQIVKDQIPGGDGVAIAVVGALGKDMNVFGMVPGAAGQMPQPPQQPQQNLQPPPKGGKKQGGKQQQPTTTNQSSTPQQQTMQPMGGLFGTAAMLAMMSHQQQQPTTIIEEISGDGSEHHHHGQGDQ